MNVSGSRRGALALVVAGALLAVLGCSAQAGSDDPAGHSQDGAASRSAAAEKARHAPVDPCRLLSVADRFSVIGAEKVTGIGAEMEPGDSRLVRCVVTGNDSVAIIYYGYSLVPGRKFAANLRDRADYSGKLITINGVGDEALYLRDTKYGFDAWARKGDYTVFVGSGWFRGDRTTAERLLKTLLDQVTPGMHEHPINVPRTCPSPDSKLVTDVVGQVQYAVGHDRNQKLLCTYAGKRVRVSLSTARSTLKKVARSYSDAQAAPTFGVDESVEFKIVPDSVTSLEPSEYGPWATTYVLKPPLLIRASMSAASDLDDDAEVTFDQAAFRRVNETWVRNRVAKGR
ncbi:MULTISPECIES: hypothetical protein [unclassified Nocardioides]|uniref:hypothetical protein n=1 Tax=unclassified Nocardioides TaxID=2615069 RepID=UPI0006FB816C|nr:MULTISPECIES: hypothetical protein [unclassified Nocardioides]KQY56753.1 hypothetical protein ASD30_10595 [Nocardioides sp. Root140]KRF12874.1 hypothetical protein ASH02_15240 [Nocardioides sp. Soil796]